MTPSDVAEPYLLSVQLLRERVPSFDAYPYCLPAIRSLERLVLHPSVTFIIGENGSGKSTLLEAIAVAWGFNAEGGSLNFNFATRRTHSELHRALRLARSARRPRDGFLLRAESFYNLATHMEELDQGPGGPPIVNSFGGRYLHEMSHGEAFFTTFMERFGGNGLYILDEPEAALSPNRQLVLLRRLHDLVESRSQFIIATHSPVIMAYPDARILVLGAEGISEVAYAETEHYRVTRSFLRNPSKVLGELLEADEAGDDSED